MRKLLAGLLASAMVMSMGATLTFAATRGASFEMEVDSAKAETDTDNVVVTIQALRLVLKDSGGKTIATVKVPVNESVRTTGKKVAEPDFIKALKGKEANVQVKNAIYRCTIKEGGNEDLKVVFDEAIPGLTDVEIQPDMKLSDGGWNNAADIDNLFTASGEDAGSGHGVTANTEGTLNVLDVLVCTPDGSPIPMAKSSKGVDKAVNDDDGIQTDSNKVYFMIRETDENGDKTLFDNDKYYRIRVSKGDNGKWVQSLKVVEKTVNQNQNLYSALNGQTIPGTAGRHRFIEVELKPNYTSDEYKLTFNMRITPTNEAIERGFAADGEELRVKDFAVWVKNIERSADNDWRVGINGLMLKPLENDWNEVTWYDEDGDVAHMKFFADSDVDSFYSKLSTKWEHVDYLNYFNDQDAYLFHFTGSPKLSSTSRADLEIYNPFFDEDGNATTDPANVRIYEIRDGYLYDITDQFEYKEGANGDMAFCIRTRFLGVYILCQKPLK